MEPSPLCASILVRKGTLIATKREMYILTQPQTLRLTVMYCLQDLLVQW